MTEQTFRSPGFFEREIDLASRRQAVSGVPGGLIGTSLKGPAFVPVTIGDFTDFVNRFGSVDADRPAVYAAYEFLKKKRALTFMRVLGAGANESAADRSNTRTQGTVKGAGFRVHGKQTVINRKNIAHSDDNETHVSATVLDGAPFLITGQHKTDIVGKSLWAANTHPVINDNPSFNADGYASMLRGVVYTSAGYRLSAMGVNDTYTYADPSLSGDAAASILLKGPKADANNTFGQIVTLSALNADQETTTTKTYVLVSDTTSDADTTAAGAAVAPIAANAVLGANAAVATTVSTRADVLGILGLNANGDEVTITVPVAAGGHTNPCVIKILTDGAAVHAQNAVANTIHVAADGNGATMRTRLIKAIAGGAAVNLAGANTPDIKYATVGTAGASGVAGIVATNGGANLVTISATRGGVHTITLADGGSGSSVADGAAGSSPANLTAGTATAYSGPANPIAVRIAQAGSDVLEVVLPRLATAIADANGHGNALLTTAFVADDGGSSELTITQANKGSVGNTAVTTTIAALDRRNAADNANATTFLGGIGGTEVILQTDGLVNLMDAANSITGQTFKLLLIGKDSQSAVYRTITASLDPEHPAYISKVLNTDPHKFFQEKHVLYLDLPVEDEVSPVAKVFVAPPSNQTITDSPFTGNYAKAWSVLGRLDTRYKTARSPAVISQPYGSKEFDLFHFESLSDGASGNKEVKISIANIKASLDPANEFGTFEVLVRRFRDLDTEPEILESYPGCTLDPNSENFIARVIGDYKAEYNFDADLEEERRLVVTGKYPNRSLFVRVKMSEVYESREVPDSALPFGFRGIPVLRTSESLTDSALVALKDGSKVIGNAFGAVTDLVDGDKTRIDTSILVDETNRRDASLASPVFPPLPYRYKVTRGAMPSSAQNPSGNPALTEKVDSKLYWGLKSERVPLTGSIVSSVLNPNAGSVFNELVTSYTKFQGLVESGALLTGSAVDNFNANKFTLARVALNVTSSNPLDIASNVTGSAREHMLEAVYFRDAVVEGSNYVVTDPIGPMGRVTMATLVSSSSLKFNRFTAYNKFTMPMYGGFDGLNLLDKDMHLMNDRASSSDTGAAGYFGKASNEFNGVFTAQTGLYEGVPGIGQRNSAVQTYRQAARIMSDPLAVSHNILAIPGIKDSFVTDFASDKVKEYSLAIYLMDIPAFSESSTRLFGGEDRKSFVSGSISAPDVRETAEQFSSRVVDNNYSAAYFPDIVISDEVNSTQVKVPASVAAMKALAFSDSVSFPWFAPAGFNRGALDNVSNVDVRLTAGDRDELYDARINPIANFPNGGFVIFGQKTLQLAQSALDRVNVRRMLLEVKRLITRVAQRLLFEPNNSETRARFINLVTPLLTTVQAQAGIDSFKVVMDDTNNNQDDVENNRLNGRIVVVPTRAIEFIAIDFIITNSGISFE